MRLSSNLKIVAALVLLPVAAQAKPKWRTVYNSSGLSVAIDTTPVARNADGSYTVWTRWDYARARVLENKKSYTRLVEKAELKCSPVAMKRVNTALFDRKGRVVKEAEEAPATEVQIMSWDPPRPGSDGEKVWAAVCKYIQKHPATR